MNNKIYIVQDINETKNLIAKYKKFLECEEISFFKNNELYCLISKIVKKITKAYNVFKILDIKPRFTLLLNITYDLNSDWVNGHLAQFKMRINEIYKNNYEFAKYINWCVCDIIDLCRDSLFLHTLFVDNNITIYQSYLTFNCKYNYEIL